MKKILMFLVSAIALCGCSSTTITDYDSLGNVYKVTKTNESAMYVGMQSLEKKDNFVHLSGWCVGANPTVNIYGVGAFDCVAGSINNETGSTNAFGYATMIDSSKVSLDITANKEGIKAKVESNETSTKTSESEAK
jgi:hypothetical protein